MDVVFNDSSLIPKWHASLTSTWHETLTYHAAPRRDYAKPIPRTAASSL